MKGIKELKLPKLKGKTKYHYMNRLKSLTRSFNKNLRKEIINLFQTKDVDWIKKNIEILEREYSSIFVKEAEKIVKDFILDVKDDLREDFNIGYSREYENQIKAGIESSVALIKNIPQKTLFQIQQDVFESIANNENETSLYKRLVTQSKITEKRAKTIARDQTAKLYSDITQISQRSSGFEYFKWVTAKDSRVSKGKGGHKQLDGKIYRWGDEKNYPVIDSYGNRGLPSQRVNCRCTAIPVHVERGFEMIKQSDGSYLPRKK